MEKGKSQIVDQRLMQIRNELKNIRTQQSAMKTHFKGEVEKLQQQLSEIGNHSSQASSVSQQNRNPERNKQLVRFEPIGYIESVYKYKNGIPRQPGICHGTRSKLAISRQNFSNPHHLLLGLSAFSHVWVIFTFHKNKDGFSATKVQPPRLNGAKVGVFATRSPYRPNAIGLTLAQIDKIEDNVVYLLGADMLDGTPVIDIKPYIPEYDYVAPCAAHKTDGSQPVNIASDGLGVNLDPTSPPENTSNVVSLPALSSAAVTDGNTEALGCEKHREPEEVGRSYPIGKSEATSELDAQSDDAVTADCNRYQEVEAVDDFTEDCNVRTCNNYLDQGLIESAVKFQTVDKFSYKSDEETERTEGEGQENLVMHSDGSALRGLNSSFTTDHLVQVADWIRNPPTVQLAVLFTPRAAKQLGEFSSQAVDSNYRLRSFETVHDFQIALESILSADPRSIYRRKQCTDRLYYMTLDCIHLTCWFDRNTVEVVKFCPARAQDSG